MPFASLAGATRSLNTSAPLPPSTMDFPDQGRFSGHDLDNGPSISNAGVYYVVIIAVYTPLLLAALFTGWIKYRHTNAVRIRGPLITTAAVLFIHIYVAALFIVYPLNGNFKCGTEFWIMNTVFPLGIALFQASNVRLKAYAASQIDMLQLKCFSEKKAPFNPTPSGLRAWLRYKWKTDEVARTYICIAIGLIIQVSLLESPLHDNTG